MENKNFTSFELDILKEVANIGTGNAATALSQILNKRVLLEVPSIELCKLPDIPEFLGGAEEIRTCICFKLEESLNGYIMFILKDDDVNRICNIIASDYGIDCTSIVSEIANIISGAYVGAFAAMIDGFINITIPIIMHDMLGSLIDSIISNLCSVADETVIISTRLTIGDEIIPAYYILMLEENSLYELVDYLEKKS